MNPRRAPLAERAEPQSARGGAPGAVIPRCWADYPSRLISNHPLECQDLGTDRLGLCPQHAAEILTPDTPYTKSRWEVG